MKGISILEYDEESNHAYVLGFNIELGKLSKDREWILRALKAEGIDLMKGYQNIHLNPILNRIAYGSKGFMEGFKNLKVMFYIKKDYALLQKTTITKLL